MMRRAALSLALVLGLASCTPQAAPPRPAAPAPAPPPPTAAPEPEAAPAAAAPAPPKEPLYPWIEHVKDAACAWRSELYRPRGAVPLKLRPGGMAFAKIAGGAAQYAIPADGSGRGVLDVRSSGITVLGVVERDDIKLYPMRSFVMKNVVYPHTNTPLHWTEGSAEGVSVRLPDVPVEITPVGGAITAKRRCNELSIDWTSPSSLNQEIFGRASGDAVRLSPGRAVAVHSDPAQPADIHVTLTESKVVDVFTTVGAYSRVGILIDHVTIAGWIKTAHLADRVHASGVGLGTTGVYGFVKAAPRAVARVICPADVLLAVSMGADTSTVGIVEAGTPIDIIQRREPATRVHVSDSRVLFEGHADLLVRSSDLASCNEIK